MSHVRAIAVALLVSGLFLGLPVAAAADQISVASVTCLNINDLNISCIDVTGPVRWRVLNWLGAFEEPFPGSNDLLDVTLQFETESSGTMSWTFAAVPPARPGGPFPESDWFDASLVREMVGLRLDASLARTRFDYPNSSVHFIADTAQVSAMSTRFPPPLDVYATGSFVSDPVPEPATITLLGLGLAAIAGSQRKRWRQRRM